MRLYLQGVFGWMLLSSAMAVGADEGPEARVSAYLDDFNDQASAAELASRHWQPPVTVYTGGSMLLLADESEVEFWLAGIQATIAKEGWKQSETLEGRVCRTGGETALYALRFLRHFSDGRSTPGAGVYILIRQDQWRIAGVILTEPEVSLTCTP